MGRWRIAAVTRLATFSRTNIRGRTSETSRKYSKMAFPRGSLSAARLPPVEKLWHGGPPTIRSTSRAPVARKSSSALRSATSDSRTVIRGLFRRIVMQNFGSISTASDGCHPASSKPRSSPMAPEKKDHTVGVPLRLRATFTSYPQTLVQNGTPRRHRRASRSPCLPCGPCRRPSRRPWSQPRPGRRRRRPRP